MKRILSHPVTALLAGFLLRLFLVLRYPGESGDTAIYEEIAVNWLKHGVYGMWLNGRWVPVDLRMPGYPTFLALIYAITGRAGADAERSVMLVQILVDLLTCLVIAVMAWFLALHAGNVNRERAKKRVFIAALWLAALCPFIANYTAVIMTEIWAVFLTAVACLFFVWLLLTIGHSEMMAPMLRSTRTKILDAGWMQTVLSIFLGLAVGFATLFRPESPLLLLAAWPVLFGLAWQKKQVRALRLCLISGVAFLVPLLPWAARNAVTLHEAQLLAPKNVTIPGEFIGYGFMAWEKTWLYRMSDCYLVPWKLEDEPIPIDTIPARAFDSPEEKQRVAMLFDQYNQTLTITPEEDRGFAEIARERVQRHPLRTYLLLPVLRAGTIWFSPRIELLPFSGRIFPLRSAWHEDPVDQSTTIGLFAINLIYLGLALCGAALLWHKSVTLRPVIVFFALLVILRTAFLTTLETYEPRYVIECFPVIIALAAQIFTKAPNHNSIPHSEKAEGAPS